MRLIHLTDPHLSSLDDDSFTGLHGKRRSGYLSWYKKRRHVHRRDVLDRLTDAIHSHRPDQILLTGDLVHIGLEHEMIEAAEWLGHLGPPEKVMFVPGNHDNYAPDSLAIMYRRWGRYLPGEYPPVEDYTAGFPIERQLGQVKLMGVNTSCVTRIFSAKGELGAAQGQRLARALEASPDPAAFQCLLIHHPPFPGITKRRKALRDAARLEEIISAKPVNLVLYGHIHCNREDHRANARSYCTASASSVQNASYRIFDLEQNDQGWHCRMRLISLENGAGQEAIFRLAAESSWQA